MVIIKSPVFLVLIIIIIHLKHAIGMNYVHCLQKGIFLELESANTKVPADISDDDEVRGDDDEVGGDDDNEVRGDDICQVD